MTFNPFLEVGESPSAGTTLWELELSPRANFFEERVMGLEPTTFALATRRTTTVLHPHDDVPQPRPGWRRISDSASACHFSATYAVADVPATASNRWRTSRSPDQDSNLDLVLVGFVLILPVRGGSAEAGGLSTLDGLCPNH